MTVLQRLAGVESFESVTTDKQDREAQTEQAELEIGEEAAGQELTVLNELFGDIDCEEIDNTRSHLNDIDDAMPLTTEALEENSAKAIQEGNDIDNVDETSPKRLEFEVLDSQPLPRPFTPIHQDCPTSSRSELEVEETLSSADYLVTSEMEHDVVLVEE